MSASEPGARVRPGAVVAPDPEGGETWIRLNGRVLRMRGSAAATLLAALDGTRGSEQLAADLGAADASAVEAALDRLRAAGVLEPDGCPDAGPLAPQLRALADLGADPTAVAARLSAARVGVMGSGILAESVMQALGDCGIGRLIRSQLPRNGAGAEGPDFPEPLDLAIVAPHQPEPETLSAMNARAMALRLPWLLVEARAYSARVGPFFLPGQTACWECYRRRLAANAADFHEQESARRAVGRAGLHDPPPDDLTPGTARVAAEACALEAVRFLASGVSDLAPELWGAFADYSLLLHRAEPHRVLRLPRCPACGPAARGMPAVRVWMEPYGPPHEE